MPPKKQRGGTGCTTTPITIASNKKQRGGTFDPMMNMILLKGSTNIPLLSDPSPSTYYMSTNYLNTGGATTDKDKKTKIKKDKKDKKDKKIDKKIDKK